ncbi:thiosulfate oxidation carrier complex protein SoxZ [Leifsonia xyli]|uniref:thiosulfate oxidation carrier complex protein SoxZ n=1 Tax=Leifsonia xyli TaxID=1575 RepID=UPI001CB87F48|nr:thiosulfate oxidation carrier complex protein SoxZ [Leifsonia xyli]
MTATDSIGVVDQPPAVSLTKTSERSAIVVPNDGDVPPGDYPANRFTLTAQNTATSRASPLRVTDPARGAAGAETSCLSAADGWDADPFVGAVHSESSPFERLDLTKIGFVSPPESVDAESSRVTLWKRAADGSTSTSAVSLRAAAELSEEELADVIGVSVVYRGTEPDITGGTIAPGQPLTMTLDTRVRVTARSSATPVTAVLIENAAFAQSYDPVLFPKGQGSLPYAAKDATVELTRARLDVTAEKSIAPGLLLERDRRTPVAVTLTATAGSATAAAHQVTITDDDPAFWNSFALTGLSAADVTLPAGADRVRVDAQTDGSPAWILGVPVPTAALPAAVAVDSVTGIRFVFLRADGGLLSRSAVPAGFAARAVLSVRLLDTARDGAAIPFPGSVENTVTALAHRTDDLVVYPDGAASASAVIRLDPGTHALDVAKTPENNLNVVAVGDSVPWTLTFANTGTGFLDIVAADGSLPPSLAWDGEAPVFSASLGGSLSADPAVSFDAETGKLVLTWPEGGVRMSPGERFTAVLGLILTPVAGGAATSTNRFVVATAQSLDSCANSSGNGQGVLTGLDAGQCGSSNLCAAGSGSLAVHDQGCPGRCGRPAGLRRRQCLRSGAALRGRRPRLLRPAVCGQHCRRRHRRVASGRDQQRNRRLRLARVRRPAAGPRRQDARDREHTRFGFPSGVRWRVGCRRGRRSRRNSDDRGGDHRPGVLSDLPGHDRLAD